MAFTASDVSDSMLRIALARGIGAVTYRRLMARFGSCDGIMGASIAAFEEVDSIGTKRALKIRRELDNAPIERERALMEAHGAWLLPLDDPRYPALLAAIPDPPTVLWGRGQLTADPDEEVIGIAIVGARRCTAYGREQASRFAGLLASCGMTIISGGARGIDGEAHRGAMRSRGRTIAVMGCGLARTYPPEHGDLFEGIIREGGALLSEYPMEMEPLREHFPQRNRVIAGLSLGVLVIEAGQGSGALITARQAAEEQGREVMCLPGRLDSATSRGCLEAIRDGWAALVLDHADVLRQLEGAKHLLRGALEAAGRAESASSAATASLFDGHLSDGQREILEVVRAAGGEAVAIDQIAVGTQRPMADLMADLTLMQIRGVLARDTRGIRLGRLSAGE